MTNGKWTKMAGLMTAVVCVAALSANPALAQSKTLTKDSLPGFLQNAGYEAETNPDYQVIRFSRDGYDFVVRVVVDETINRVWVLTKTTVAVTDINQVPGTTLQKLLQANRLMGPSFFMMNENGILYMARAFDSNDVTAVKFRKELDQFCVDYKDHADLLNPKLWTKASIGFGEQAARLPG